MIKMDFLLANVSGMRPTACQYDMLNSAFRPLAACCRVVESSAEPDNRRIRGRSTGF